jgi:hypothetical protein
LKVIFHLIIHTKQRHHTNNAKLLFKYRDKHGLKDHLLDTCLSEEI